MNKLFCDNVQKRLRIKICGLSRMKDIRMCSALHVDALGFLVKKQEDMPTYSNTDIISPKNAKMLIEQLPYLNYSRSVLLVKYSDIEYIKQLISDTNPNIVQLQKEANNIKIAEVIKELFPNIGIIKTLNAGPATSFESICERIDEYAPFVHAINLDSVKGGSGKTHDWEISSPVCEYVHKKGLSFVLAGGITAQNMEEAYRIVKPDIIDIMSGSRYEDRKDQKDPEKIAQIMAIANKINQL